MLTASAAILIGFIGLIWSADRFVNGAAAIAANFGMAPILIGLTIVAFGTSAPEIIVSTSAALNDAGALAIGNALGSNLANIGMVLGITALIAPIPIAATITRRELPLLLAATFGAAYCLFDNNLDQLDGILLLGTLVAIMAYLVNAKAHQPDAELEADVEHIQPLSNGRAWMLFVVGLALLIASSEALVWGAQEVARSLGVSELIIGLTVIAIGTSLPELAATVASALKGHHDIALGNIVGSNLFNLLAVMAMPALINPFEFAPEVFNRDYIAMAAITLLLAAIVYSHLVWTHNASSEQAAYKHGHIGRVAGALLIVGYGTYYYWLFPMS